MSAYTQVNPFLEGTEVPFFSWTYSALCGNGKTNNATGGIFYESLSADRIVSGQREYPQFQQSNGSDEY
jgi:hypothetical protein